MLGCVIYFPEEPKLLQVGVQVQPSETCLILTLFLFIVTLCLDQPPMHYCSREG